MDQLRDDAGLDCHGSNGDGEKFVNIKKKKNLGFTIKCREIKWKLQWKFGTEIEIKFILLLIAYVSLLA